jgi:hypothetical protein
MTKIVKHIFFSQDKLFVDFQKQFSFESNLNFGATFKSLYKALKLDYPKYFKMDSLSKLGFLAAEILLQDSKLRAMHRPEKIGIVIENSSSTILMDTKHQETLNNKEAYFPSPANFVYTLPNILTGEICIRHKIQGENVMFISSKFDAEMIATYVEKLFDDKKITACLAGYIEINEENYEAFLLLIENSFKDPINEKQLIDIYSKYKNRTNAWKN